MTFANQVLDFHKNLKPNWKLPPDFELLYPYGNAETWAAMTAYYQKFYSNEEPRTFLLGINPGRFGAGVTGVPFTDPIRLQEFCGIENDFKKRQELSSVFVWDFIEALGGAKAFHSKFYISSICPLGFTKGGNNINYYDDKMLQKAVEPYIISNLKTQIEFGCNRHSIIILGQGKNYKYFKKLNEKLGLWKEVLPLPHPRWVMQYRLKRKEEFLNQYVKILNEAHSKL
ncbi:MAG: DUF4918 family protein [Bacteroidetes bacterium]|jgi:uracil-DNA glycosylase|nr:DUF4918 family protein [Bacteroidota bacterium]